MLVVIVGDVLVRDVNLGSDFLVKNLIDRERAADVSLEVLQTDLLVFQSGFELFTGIGRLVFVQLAVNLVVGSQQPEFLGAVHDDFVFNQLAQNVQPQAGSLLAGRLLVGACSLVLVVLLNIRAVDFLTINGSGDIVAHALAVAAECSHNNSESNQSRQN